MDKAGIEQRVSEGEHRLHAGVCRDGRGRKAGLWGERGLGAARSGDREGGLSGANPVAWPRADEAPSMLVRGREALMGV